MTSKDDLKEFVYRGLCAGKSLKEMEDELGKHGWGEYMYERPYALREGFNKFKKDYPKEGGKIEQEILGNQLKNALMGAAVLLIIVWLLQAGGWNNLMRLVGALVGTGI